MGLFGSGLRLVVIDGVEAWKAPDAKAVADYLKVPMPGTTLALVGGELKKDTPIAKAVSAGKGEVLLWDVAQRARRSLDRRAVQGATAPGPSPRRAVCLLISSATISTTSRAKWTSSRRGRTVRR